MNTKNLAKGRKAQITIFIVIAIILIVSIILVVMLIRTRVARVTIEEDPAVYMANCVKDSLEKIEAVLLEGNGYINKSDNYILYNGEKVPYLCKASQFYNPCIAQEPMFIGHLRNEFEKQLREDAENCFSELVKALEKRGYDVEEGKNWSLEIEFREKSVVANLNRQLSIKREEETRIFDRFQAEIQSPIYSLAKTAMVIVNFESTLCEFNNINWMRNFPEVSIKKFVASDATKIYTVSDRTSKKEINIAIKTCVLPAGI